MTYGMHDTWLPDAIAHARGRVLAGEADQRAALAELEVLITKEARHSERNRVAVELGQARQLDQIAASLSAQARS